MKASNYRGLPWMLFLAGCASTPAGLQVTVTNELDVSRRAETVSVPWRDVAHGLPDLLPGDAAVEDARSGALLVTQLVDRDDDGLPEELLFQADLQPGERGRFLIRAASDETIPTPSTSTFGRYVPERMDDFAWENDIVAFRMYGPALAADAVNSGVDCWLKRVDHPIIDKWYRENLEGKSYHEDHGEGYDPYHVGGSRGCGGLAVWKEGRMYASGVYAGWKMLANGPLRTEFELTYDPWDADGREIVETKRIRIDLHARFVCFESSFLVDGRSAPLDVAIGITTHDEAAVPALRAEAAWIRCWETIDGDGLGTGVVLDPGVVSRLCTMQGHEPDDGHVLAIATTDEEGRITYWAGYGWERAADVRGIEAWDRILTETARRCRSPLRVVVGDE